MNRPNIPIVEVFLSCVSVWWSFVLFMSAGKLTQTLPRYMEDLGKIHEIGWGFIFLTAAIVKIVGLATFRPRWRKAGLIMSMVLYSLITTGYILAHNIVSTGTGVYFLLLVLAWWGWREVVDDGTNE